ncbi:MAG: hypothetical protein U9N62_04215 [Thermotogota bacterium]|nr:hypothetical protein [Thermotogota bacterium]
MSTIFPDVIVNIPSEVWDYDSGGFNMCHCHIDDNTFEFHATKTYTDPVETIDLTSFSVGENSITGTIKYEGTSVQVTGTRQ